MKLFNHENLQVSHCKNEKACRFTKRLFYGRGAVGRFHSFLFEILELFLRKEKSIENMKKIVVLLLGLFGWMQIASAQLFDKDTMEEVNSKFAVDWKMGVLGVFDFMPNSCVGVSVLYNGFYLDFMFSPTKHLQNTRIDKWKDGRGYAFHFGYQLLFSESFRCVPIIGIAKIEVGITDGYDWSYSDGIRNKFIPEKTSGGFDYGLTLVYNFMWIIPVNTTLTASRYALTAVVGFEFLIYLVV